MLKTSKHIITLFLFLVGISQHNFAQNFADKEYYLVDSLEIEKVSRSDRALIDSCLAVFHQTKHDTEKVLAITVIIETSWDDNVWPKYNLWLNKYLKHKLSAGTEKHIEKMLLRSLAGTINNIGFNYKNQGDIEKALEYYHQSLRLHEKQGNKKDVAVGLNNIGIVLEEQGEVEKALEYYHKSLKIQKEIGDKKGIARSYSNIGITYISQLDLNNAIKFCRKATVIQEEIGDKKGLATSLNNLAAIYSKQGNIKRALEYYQKSLAMERETGNKQGIAWALNNVGRSWNAIGNFTEAIKHVDESMKIGKSLESPILIQNAALTFVEIYEKQGKGIEALEMFRVYIEMRDKLNNEKTQKAAIEQQAKYEYETQKVLDDAANEKGIALKEEERKQQKIISIATGVGLFLVVIFLLFVANRLQVTRKQKVVIEEQNKEIVDSITYAKRIQDAILPTDTWVKKCLPNSFIYYQPKDIVAGDFYWVESLTSDESRVMNGVENTSPRTQNSSHILFAAADCTGHGVPGAMMSVVCHNAMNRVIGEFNITDPGAILDKTREIIVKQLNKSGNTKIETIGNIRDGMDIALCSFNAKTNELKYAGAHNPLWVLREGGNEMEEIKATKQSVGNVDNPKPYQTHVVKLNKGDTVYLFSDGYVDQFGGEKGKKLKSKPFKQLLISNAEKPMSEQKELLQNFFNTWKGDLEQIDDVCVFGLRVCQSTY